MRQDLNVAVVVRQLSPHGGLELYAHKVIEGLLERGHRVTVLCERSDSDLSGPGFKVARWIGASGGPKWMRLEKQFSAANSALARLEETERFDIINSQHCPVQGANVVTFHNHSVERLDLVGLPWEMALNRAKRILVPAYRLRRLHDEILCRNAVCLIFGAQVMKEDFYSVHPFLQEEPKPWVIAPPGAALQIPDSGLSASGLPGTEANLAASCDQRFGFLFVGRGYRKKGLDVLLESCRILRRRGRNFVLRIAGLAAKPADRARLAIMGLGDVVEYLGFRKDMDAVYARARAIVLPSRVEPFGMAPVQAMRHGLVPVVSKVAGVSELLSHEIDSLILQDHLSSAELASLMERLILDGELTARLGAEAVKTAQAINWQITVDRTLEAYEIALTHRM